MSKLQELINKLCPNGVEFKPIWSLTTWDKKFKGVDRKMQPNVIKGTPSNALNAFDFISEVKSATIAFYDKIPQETIYKGITSECETFIQNINKYDYLFHLCDVRPY